MRYSLAVCFCFSVAACAVDTGPAPGVGADAEALTYADNCVAKAFVTIDNGAFVVGKVVGNGTSVRGHWLHLSAPIAAPAPAGGEDDEGDCDHEGDDRGHADCDHDDHGGDCDRDDEGDHRDGHGDGGHADCDHDDGDDDCDHDDGDDDDCDHDDGDDDDGDHDGHGGPSRHVIVGHPNSIICRPNGGYLAHIEGDATFDGASGYTFALQLDDLSARGLPNLYVIVVYDPSGALVYSDPFDRVQTGTSSVVITGPPSLPTP